MTKSIAQRIFGHS